MRSHTLTAFLNRLRLPRSERDVADGMLLRQFLAEHDEGAFAELVRRHGAMVLAVCRRVLRHEQDAEEAFQATFLLLACKGDWIAPRQPIGAWLHGVAWRSASQVRRSAIRRHGHERRAGMRAAALPATGPNELACVLDEEVARLPDHYRAPVVLCLLEGRTLRDAAGILGWPEGSVSGRLTRARRILARRLERRGFAPVGAEVSSVVALAALPAARASDALMTSAARLAGAEGLVSGRVVAVMESVWHVIWRTMMQKVIAVVLVVTLAATGIVLGVAPRPADEPRRSPPVERAKVADPQPPAEKPAAQDQLPTGAIPVQVLARLQDEELLVTVQVNYFEPRTAALPDGTLRTSYLLVRKTNVRKYDLAKVRVHDTKGKDVPKRDLARLLRKDRPAVASVDGQPVDPLHLRILKEDVPVLILPAPEVPPIPAVPVVPPAAAPGVIMPPAAAGPLPPPPAPVAPPRQPAPVAPRQ